MQTPTRIHWINVLCVALALFVLASTFADQDGRWGEHWSFVVAYGVIGFYCLMRSLWLGAVTCLSLVLLRIAIVLDGRSVGTRAASTVFVVLLFALCMEKAGDLPLWLRRRVS